MNKVLDTLADAVVQQMKLDRKDYSFIHYNGNDWREHDTKLIQLALNKAMKPQEVPNTWRDGPLFDLLNIVEEVQ